MLEKGLQPWRLAQDTDIGIFFPFTFIFACIWLILCMGMGKIEEMRYRIQMFSIRLTICSNLALISNYKMTLITGPVLHVN